MTLLQKAVIQRLREADYNSQADAAKDAWSHGERVNLPNMVHPNHAELRSDYERCQEHAAAETADG